MRNNIHEKAMYLLDHMDFYIEQSIYDVLNDSVEDPQYSAVTTNNLIRCYIDVMLELGGSVGFTCAEEYMASKCFSAEEIAVFRNKMDSEAKYYIGKVF